MLKFSSLPLKDSKVLYLAILFLIHILMPIHQLISYQFQFAFLIFWVMGV